MIPTVDWPEFYARLAKIAETPQLPSFENGKVVGSHELGELSLKVQRVRDQLAAAHAKAQEKLQECRRQLIRVKHLRKAKFNSLLAYNSQVSQVRNREQRNAMANSICWKEDDAIMNLEIAVTDWEAAVSAIDEYIKSVETAKVTIGRIQRSILAELESSGN